MTGPFKRGLCDAFMADLTSGVSVRVLDACRAAGLDVRLRNDYVNAYAAGRSVACIQWTNGAPRYCVHRKYLLPGAFPGITRKAQGPKEVLPITQAFAAMFRDELVGVMQMARPHERIEEHSESRLLHANAGDGVVFCVDRQIQIPGIQRKLDVTGVLRGDTPTLVLVELKRDLDNRIQDAPQQLVRYLNAFSSPDRGLRADVASSLSVVARQLAELGFPAPDRSSFADGMPVVGLLVLVRYNHRSELLERANAQARDLDWPLWMWLPDNDEKLEIPSPSEWTQMG